ncbi:MAG: tetratricopeptide repeat protein [Candidatus Omnitrophica bacterium]|nr:tetratricopeptide repeat protein [Candidatus Omnitrophota bacterium]
MKKHLFSVKLLAITVMCCMISTYPAFAQTDKALDLRIQGYKAQKEDDNKKAVSLYKKAIRADASYATPHNDLAVVYELEGQLDKAEKEYLAALQINPNYAGVYSNLASLYEKKGDYKRALAYWEKRATMGGANDSWVKKAKENIARLQGMIAKTGTAKSGQEDLAEKKLASQVEKMIVQEEKKKEKKSTQKIKVEKERKVKVVPQSEYLGKLVKQAKNEINEQQYQDALRTLYQARGTTQKVKEAVVVDDLINEARLRSIDFELARASINADIYKEAKLVEVEKAWYPPVSEIETVAGAEPLKTTMKSAARLELEEKACQIIPSINFSEAQLKEVVEFLAVSNDINIVIDETVVPSAETVTIHLKNIPLNEALDIILRTKGLKHRFEENIVWITTEEKLLEEDLAMRVYDVQDLVGKLFDFPSTPFDFESNLELGEEE